MAKKKGFKLVELVMVLVVFGILVSSGCKKKAEKEAVEKNLHEKVCLTARMLSETNAITLTSKYESGPIMLICCSGRILRESSVHWNGKLVFKGANVAGEERVTDYFPGEWEEKLEKLYQEAKGISKTTSEQS